MAKRELGTLWLGALGLMAVLCLSMPALADDDAPISLAPVEKRAAKAETPVEQATAQPTAAPTSAQPLSTATVEAVVTPTVVPSPIPTAVPKPKPAAKASLKILGLEPKRGAEGLDLVLKASGPVMGKVSKLKSPDRILVVIPAATLAGAGKQTFELGAGDALRARLAQKGSEVWAVIDLLGPVEFKTLPGLKHAFGLRLATGAKPAEAQPTAVATAAAAKSSSTAQLPHVQMMLFDKNVLFQGKQYDRFPCANLIYDKGDAFPLDREFTTILVFSQGYGAFVGNLRVVGPEGNVVEQTREPFAFNLFNALTDYSVETPWKLHFEKKGWYRLVLTLNGEDTLEHKFYVGHNDDKP